VTPGLRKLVIAVLVPAVWMMAVAGCRGQTKEAPPPSDKNLRVATFSGGCFWCMEHPFDELEGVVSTTSGYTGGRLPNPTYEQVSSGATGHAESIRVVYDPARVTYRKLLEVFWRNIDPVARNGQFCDAGNQYRSAIYYNDETEKKQAEASRAELQASGRFQQPIATLIEPASTFYAAEDYHQDYYQKNPLRYKFYRYNCGRDQRLEEIWGAPEHK
jgi:peptide-methionine (S)-S-oxide reductase